MFFPHEKSGLKNNERTTMMCAVENVFWKMGRAPHGRGPYQVFVQNYTYRPVAEGGSERGAPIKFSLQVLINDKEVRIGNSEGTTTEIAGETKSYWTVTGSCTKSAVQPRGSEGQTFVGEFEYTPFRGCFRVKGRQGLEVKDHYGSSNRTIRTLPVCTRLDVRGRKLATRPLQHVNDYHAFVTETYRKHNPAKLEAVSKVLQTYAGREQQLLVLLEEKVGISDVNSHLVLIFSSILALSKPTVQSSNMV
jgi:hypothetical protein